MTEKNNFFSYRYEQNGDAWELKYNDFIIQIVQTTDNFKDLYEFRKLINESKTIFFYMPFSLIVALLLITVLAANKYGKKHLEEKRKIIYTIIFMIAAISFGMSSIELSSNTKELEYIFFDFPESPPYPK